MNPTPPICRRCHELIHNCQCLYTRPVQDRIDRAKAMRDREISDEQIEQIEQMRVWMPVTFARLFIGGGE